MYVVSLVLTSIAGVRPTSERDANAQSTNAIALLHGGPRARIGWIRKRTFGQCRQIRPLLFCEIISRIGNSLLCNFIGILRGTPKGESYASVNYNSPECQPVYKPKVFVVGIICFLIGTLLSKKVWWWNDSYLAIHDSIAVPFALLALSAFTMWIGMWFMGVGAGVFRDGFCAPSGGSFLSVTHAPLVSLAVLL
ncbi:MAG TPA: hypothetical protein VK752_17870 [Bryobacteraceae bacterium]|nr:hypothetical protein [Bryobacteraceae bacterium]